MIRVFVGMPSGTGYPHPDAILNVFNQKIDKKSYEIKFTMESIPQRVPKFVPRPYQKEFYDDVFDYTSGKPVMKRKEINS